MSGEKKVCHGDHSKHLCALEAQGKLEEIEKVTQKKTYVCINCRRAADNKENLCNPQ